MTKLNWIQKLMLIGMVVLAIACSCQKTECNSQSLQTLENSDVVIDTSRTSLQAGLVDSQKVDYDTPPKPVGGFEKIRKYLIFPEFAKKAALVLNCKINEKGEMVNREDKEGPRRFFRRLTNDQLEATTYCFSNLVSVIIFSKWTPAMKNGKPITAWITLPIQYEGKLVPPEFSLPPPPPPPPPPPLPPSPDDTAYYYFSVYDEPPEPIGGFEAIKKNITYPETAKKAGIEGTVEIRVKIDQNGDVIEIEIFKSFGSKDCNEAGIEAIKKMKWIPAKLRGKPVMVWVTIPVRFTLK